MEDILNNDFVPVNIGLSKFARDLVDYGYSVIEKKWTPPPGGDPELSMMLADLADDNNGLGLRI